MQNLTINNIYIFVSITFVNLIILLSYIIEIILKINTFVAIFFSILRCYLNNIFYSKLNIKNILKFIVNLFFIATIDIFDFFNTRSFLNLICIFNIFIFIALSFVLYLIIK